MKHAHLPVQRLEPWAEPPLSQEEQTHIGRCPRCRLEHRMLHELAGEVPPDLPGLDLAQQSMQLLRSSMRQGFSTQTHLMGVERDTRSLSEVLAQIPEMHYETVGPIGIGGMGEVWRVRDLRLRRQVAMKWLQASRLSRPAVVERFIQEARVTAQLQHPGIVPVHEFGQLPDGRPYFTMKEVRGRTLHDVAGEVHQASSWGMWMAAPSGWTFRRLVDAFHRACEAVAYAHSQGVVHRDIKPANIMVGAYGEVQVLDWGLAKVLGQPEGTPDPLAVDHERGGVQETRHGSIVGTLPYMPPEQARGDMSLLGSAVDVYALGATLYHILTGRPPFVGTTEEVLMAVCEGSPAPLATLIEELRLPPIPADLIRICEAAMARDPAQRPADAGALAAEVADWLDGARRREQALAVVAEADVLLPEIERLRRRVSALEARLAAARGRMAGDAPIEERRPVWATEDEMETLRDRIAVAEVEYLQLLRAALTHEPDLVEAHDRLADHHRAQHAEAEAQRDRAAARRHELLLRAHGGARFAEYLEGDGSLSLVTDPPGAEVVLFRNVGRDRRLVPEEARSLGVAPIKDAPLPMGSYLVELRAPGRAPARYPVHLRRQERWDGRPPGAPAAEAVPLLPAGALSPGEVYVPAGWCLTGGDDAAQDAWPARRLWVGGFVIRAFPVTNAEYLSFLNDLVRRGREEDALRHAPRERPGTHGARGALIYARGGDGRFELRADADADLWDARWPVIMIDWLDACAYAAWLSERSGLPWRLPHELEWEKAARGVDGRSFPWGDDFESLYCCMRESPPGRRSPAVVDSFPEDVSPYGVRGMAGNVGDWCLNPYDEEPPPDGSRLRVSAPAPEGAAADGRPRAKRGGAWQHDALVLRVAERHGLAPSYHSAILGFRLLRPVGEAG